MILPEFEISNENGVNIFSYSYEGICNTDFLVAFTGYLSDSFEQIMTPQEFKTVLFCSNELLQNMGFYSEEKAEETNTNSGIGKFRIIGTESDITMSSTNMIQIERFEKLNSKLVEYNALNPDELKALYKQKLKEESPEDSKGGGIGFIEIIRKSKNPIICTLHEEENKYYLTLQTKIRRSGNNE